MPNINLYLNEKLNEEIKEIANKNNVSKTDIINTIITENVERYKNESED